MKKGIISFFIIVLLLSWMPNLAFGAPGNARLSVAGKQQDSYYNPVYVDLSSVVTPAPTTTTTTESDIATIRLSLLETMGYAIHWGTNTLTGKRKIIVQKYDDTIIYTLNSKEVIVNDVKQTLPVAVKILNQSVYIPIGKMVTTTVTTKAKKPVTKITKTFQALPMMADAFHLQLQWNRYTRAINLVAIPVPVEETPAPTNPSTDSTTPTNPADPTQPTDPEQPPAPETPKLTDQANEIATMNVDAKGNIVFGYTGKLQTYKVTILPKDKVKKIAERIVVDVKDFAFQAAFNGNQPLKGTKIIDNDDKVVRLDYSYTAGQTYPLRMTIYLKAATKFQVRNADGQLSFNFFDTVLTQSSQIKNIIMLDPGHGGPDPGARGMLNRKPYFEKDFTLATALKTKARLDLIPSLLVVMTRENKNRLLADYSADLSARPDLANSMNANLYISFHANSSPKSSPRGFETYYFNGYSQRLGQTLHPYGLKAMGIPDRGLHSNQEFRVITRTMMPAVLFEFGFISNPLDVKLLSNPQRQTAIATQLTLGIKKYLKL